MSLFSIPTNDLIVIELDDGCEESFTFCASTCSKGTYFKDGECIPCAKGSYSDEIGPGECKLCEAGYFSDTVGADNENFCKPCPYGTFNQKPGESRCYDCPYGSSCSLYEIETSELRSLNQNFTSFQPEIYKSNEETSSLYSHYFNVILSVFSSLTIIILLSFDKTRKLIPSFDIYQFNHNYETNKKMIKRKTLFGGVFTLIFISIASSIMFKTTLSLAIDNIHETKALVPLVALEEKYENVIYI